MASLTDLEMAIDRLLSTVGSGHYKLISHKADKAYEAYIFGLCLKAAKRLGAKPVLRGITGAPVPFTFRGGPGSIHSDRKNYGYATFEFNNHLLEIHVCVEFTGQSQVVHEIDVCIMRSKEAKKARLEEQDPPARSLVVALECKFYDKKLDKSLGREFVGLMDDMSEKIRFSGLCSNNVSDQLERYFSKKDRPYANFNLSPLNLDIEKDFVTNLFHALKKLTAGKA